MHDIGALPPYRRPDVDHAQRSAEVAAEALPEAGFPVDKLPLVREIILHHMFSAEPGSSRESVLLRDADTLDFLGAIGAARLLAIVGLDDWTPNLAKAVAVIKKFHDELPAKLMTPRAREIGGARKEEGKAFLAALGRETGHFTRL